MLAALTPAAGDSGGPTPGRLLGVSDDPFAGIVIGVFVTIVVLAIACRCWRMYGGRCQSPCDPDAQAAQQQQDALANYARRNNAGQYALRTTTWASPYEAGSRGAVAGGAPSLLSSYSGAGAGAGAGADGASYSYAVPATGASSYAPTAAGSDLPMARVVTDPGALSGVVAEARVVPASPPA